MDRRPLAVLLVAGLMGAAPTGASAASAGALLAQTQSGTLSESPSVDLVAQNPKGTLSETPRSNGAQAPASSGGSSSGSSASAAPTATATASALPFTGSDPRVTLLLGIAAALVGAGLRLRTGDARDF